MSETRHPRTTRDALIIEAIGDIGELIQRISELEKKAFEEKLNASVAKTVNRMVNEVKRQDGLSVRSQLLIALAIAVMASAISIWGSYWMFGRERDEQAALGRAVMSVWSELDEQTRLRIEQAY